MKIVIAPDSYKGSLSALQVADVIARAFTDVWKDAGRNGTEAGELDLVKAPMADGGEGTVDSLVAATGGRRVAITVSGPLGKPVEAFYGVLADGETAVLEVANICGLPMLAKHERDPEQTTSAGLGEAIRTVLDAGYRKLIVGLGGSACNDGGLGMLQALGGIFLDTTGRPVSPTGKGVTQVSTVRMDSVDKRLAECDIRIASDVDNPLCGPEGASFVFGPQKGASEEQMRRLDAALAEYAKRVEAACGRSSADESYAARPGAGAAGGLGFALQVLGGKMESGARLVADAIGLEKSLVDADWLVTGEGRTDGQTVRGKLPVFVARLARTYGVPAVLVSGGVGDGWERLQQEFISIHAITPGPISLEEAMMHAGEYLYRTAWSIARLIQAGASR